MQVEKYGYKWTQKKSGYFQSTVDFPDGKRHWLHQEVYLREKGDLLAGHHIHHKDEDKCNNTPDNLEQVCGVMHSVEHMKDPVRIQTSSRCLKENNAHMQELAQAARRGEYLGQHALRQLRKGNKVKQCAHCAKTFTLKDTDKDSTHYCSFECAQRGSRINRGMIPLGKRLCMTCHAPFVQKSGNQFCCSNDCRKVQTELVRKNKTQIRDCIKCGRSYETIKSSKRKYCSDACRKSNRA